MATRQNNGDTKATQSLAIAISMLRPLGDNISSTAAEFETLVLLLQKSKTVEDSKSVCAALNLLYTHVHKITTTLLTLTYTIDEGLGNIPKPTPPSIPLKH